MAQVCLDLGLVARHDLSRDKHPASTLGRVWPVSPVSVHDAYTFKVSGITALLADMHAASGGLHRCVGIEFVPVEHRDDLVKTRTQTINRLYVLLTSAFGSSTQSPDRRGRDPAAARGAPRTR